MLVGLQRMGKTTLLQKLREVNEVSDTSHTTFNQRVTGEASVSPAASSNPRRGRTTGWVFTVQLVNFPGGGGGYFRGFCG